MRLVYPRQNFLPIACEHDETGDERTEKVDLNVFDPKRGLAAAAGWRFQQTLEEDGSEG